MAERFFDDFNRADGAIGGNWAIKFFDFGSVVIVNQSATNLNTDPAGARVIADHPLDTDEQELSAAFALAGVNAGDALYLGLGSDSVVYPMGFAARFRAVAFDSFALDVIADVEEQITAPAPTVATTVAVSPLLNDAGTMIGIAQLLRLRLRRTDGGYELLVYFNEPDDEKPTLTWRYMREHENPTTFGRAWFRPHSDTASNRVLVGSIEWRTLALTTGQKASQWQLPHRPTLAEIRADVLAVVERRASSPNADPDYVNPRINWAQDEILNELGDRATFLRYRESITLSFDGNNVAALPFRIGRLLNVQDANEVHVGFSVLGYNTSGQTLVRLLFVPSGTLTITYEPLREKMIRDTDRCLIPDQFSTVLMWKAAMLLLASDTSSNEYKLAEVSYERAFASMLSRLAQHQRGSRTVMGVGPMRSISYTTNAWWR